MPGEGCLRAGRKGEDRGHLQGSLSGHRIPREVASLRPHCLAPGREERAGSESMQESGDGNLFRIRTAGKLSIGGFVS